MSTGSGSTSSARRSKRPLKRQTLRAAGRHRRDLKARLTETVMERGRKQISRGEPEGGRGKDGGEVMLVGHHAKEPRACRRAERHGAGDRVSAVSVERKVLVMRADHTRAGECEQRMPAHEALVLAALVALREGVRG